MGWLRLESRVMEQDMDDNDAAHAGGVRQESSVEISLGHCLCCPSRDLTFPKQDNAGKPALTSVPRGAAYSGVCPCSVILSLIGSSVICNIL